MNTTRLITILALLLAFPASAQFNGCSPGFCNQAASAAPAACEGGLQNANDDCLINADGSFVKAAP